MSEVILNTDIRENGNFKFDAERTAQIVCEEVLAEEKCPYDCEISLVLTGPDEIQEINRQFRDIDRVTDVLSFPGLDYGTPSDFSVVEGHEADYTDPDNGYLTFGDIVINVERVREQAASYGHSERREFAFLVAHSMFHLCGYDHMTPEEAAVMEEKQERVLSRLHITREVRE